MKNKILILIFILFTLFIVGCTEESVLMYIESSDTVIINEYLDMKVYYNNEEVSNEDLEWSLSDYDIASIVNDKLYAKAYGKVVVTVIDMKNQTHYCAKEIEVVPPFITDIKVVGAKEVMVGKTISLSASIVPSIIEGEIIWSSSNEDIILVDKGKVYAVGVGNAEVILQCDDFEKRYPITVNPMPTHVEIKGKSEISINEVVSFSFNIEDEVVLESSNPAVVEIVDSVAIGVDLGTAIITAYKKSDPKVKGTFEISVNGKFNNISITDEEQKQIDEIIEKMSIEELIGQMFSVGFDSPTSSWDWNVVPIEASTGLPYVIFDRNATGVSVLEYFKDYKFGNFNIKARNAESRNNLQLVIQTLNTLGKTNSNVYPLLTIDYSGGKEYGGLNSLPSNLALASSNIRTVDTVTDLFAEELQAMGINAVKNIYLNNNLNHNDQLCTYGKNISKAVSTAKIMSSSYKDHNVIMIPDISVTNVYLDDREEEEIKKADFRLIEAAIKNGAEMISVPFTSYEKIVNEYFFLSDYYMNEYLRKELHYDGVIMLDDSIIQTFLYEENINSYIERAINLGVDMISFDFRISYNRWTNYESLVKKLLGIYDYLVSAVNNGTISMDRIKEAVTRILLVKLRNNVLKDKEVKNFDYEEQKAKLTNHMSQFITAIGDIYKLSKDEKIMVISENFESTGTSNSFGDSFTKYFRQQGYNDVDVFHGYTSNPESLLNKAAEYDKIIISLSTINEKTNIGYGSIKTNFIQFIKDIKVKNPNVCLIFTGPTSMKNYFEDFTNYIYLYGFYEDDFESLCRVLNQEAEPNTKFIG